MCLNQLSKNLIKLSNKLFLPAIVFLVIILIAILLVFLINNLYKILVKNKIIEGYNSCKVNKKWKEDMNNWCIKSNNKIDKLQKYFNNVDGVNKSLDKINDINKKKLSKVKAQTGNPIQQAGAMDTFNKCAQGNCPPPM